MIGPPTNLQTTTRMTRAAMMTPDRAQRASVAAVPFQGERRTSHGRHGLAVHRFKAGCPRAPSQMRSHQLAGVRADATPQFVVAHKEFERPDEGVVALGVDENDILHV